MYRTDIYIVDDRVNIDLVEVSPVASTFDVTKDAINVPLEMYLLETDTCLRFSFIGIIWNAREVQLGIAAMIHRRRLYGGVN